jgi:hypothetical protein
LLPVLFNSGLEYAITKVKEKQVRVQLIRTHQLLVNADDVNILGDNINRWRIFTRLKSSQLCPSRQPVHHWLRGACEFCTMKKNTETLIDTSKKVGLEVQAEKTKYMFLYRHQNAGQKRNMKIANRSSKMWHSSNIWGQQ